MITIELPMPYYKGKALMSMNVYRNMHHYQLNNFKTEYGAKLKKIMQDYDKLETPLALHYELHFKGSKKRDVMNIASMVDKVFSDVLVQLKLIPDDDYENVHKVTVKGFGNAEEDRCIVRISEAVKVEYDYDV